MPINDSSFWLLERKKMEKGNSGALSDLQVCQSISLSARLFVCLSICLYAYLSVKAQGQMHEQQYPAITDFRGPINFVC